MKAHECGWSNCPGTLLLRPRQYRGYSCPWEQLCGYQQPSFSSASVVFCVIGTHFQSLHKHFPAIPPPTSLVLFYSRYPVMCMYGWKDVCMDECKNGLKEGRKQGKGKLITKMSPVLPYICTFCNVTFQLLTCRSRGSLPLIP